ncbi:conserved hypothetical protein [Magnetococcus marinus MC-1]|uniref:Cadmium carbonic anhydrase n=1 Tax=Magnetococcus marinus (strain ATCC BAA-1437 / JCM 17883 / MC-1) TaxID=156889 RepID=A0LDG0_MAGMM|nr:delta-class carbonic anhydrase [Magnetococcus marinus]ABK46003.1 conserved hypothetical protein [Magnetococcus marinus MC-1]
MKTSFRIWTLMVSISALSLSFSSPLFAKSAHEEPMDAAHHAATPVHGAACVGFGPQAPRDIDAVEGSNARLFSFAPSKEQMNLCNIHFHTHAEHKAKAFSIFAGAGEHGHGGGYQCAISQSLSPEELTMPKENHCGGVKPGDTLEVHWVYTSCDVKPGKGLGSCLSEGCSNPNLRVESQVFAVVNDANALDFDSMDYDGTVRNGYHQAKSIPDNTGTPVQFLGSTTGPKYTEQSCSPMQVTWSVRPECAKIDITSLSRWCGENAFAEEHAHGVRTLVTNPALLSTIP